MSFIKPCSPKSALGHFTVTPLESRYMLGLTDTVFELAFDVEEVWGPGLLQEKIVTNNIRSSFLILFVFELKIKKTP